MFFAATMLVPALMLGSFEKLLDYIIFTDTLTIAAVASTLFVLRRRRTGDGGYSMRGYPLLPALYIACLLAVAARAFSVDPGIGGGGHRDPAHRMAALPPGPQGVRRAPRRSTALAVGGLGAHLLAREPNRQSRANRLIDRLVNV